MASKSISKSVVWEIIGKFAIEGIVFFTAPIFTRILTPSDYGYTALYNSWSSIVVLFIGLQVHGSIGNARIKYGEKSIYSFLSSIVSISCISFLLFLLIATIFKEKLSQLLNIREDLVIFLVIQSFFSAITTCFMTKLTHFKQVEKSTIIALISSILSISCSLIFVLRAKENLAIIKIYANGVPSIIFGLLVLIIIYSKGKTIWNKEYNMFCLSLVLPLILHNLGHLVFTQSDRIMLEKMYSGASLGIYSVSYSLCNILMIIYGALNNAWVPFYYDYKKQGKIDDILFHSKRYLKFFTLICVGFILLSYDVYKIMVPFEYYEGMNIIPLFVLSFYFGFLYLFPVNFEFYNLRTKLIPIGTILAAVVNIVVNYLLIPVYGLIGAAIGTVISHILLFIFHEIIAKRIKTDNYEYRIKIFIPGLIVIILFCVFTPLLKNLWYIRWGVAILDAIYLLKDIIKNRSIF